MMSMRPPQHGSALPVLVRSGNLSLEIWSSDGCRLKYNATIETAFVLMPTALRALLVVAHPLDNAFAKAAAERIRATLDRRGIEVDIIDLYADNFDPRLTGAERRGYFTTPYDSKAVAGYVGRLRLAEKFVFVFPQWWFNVPAILKGSNRPLSRHGDSDAPIAAKVHSFLR